MFSGPWEIILVIVIILLLFGPKRLPDLARALGRSLSEFRKGKEEGVKSLEEDKKKEPSETQPKKDA